MGVDVPARNTSAHARPSRLRELSHGLAHPFVIAVVIAVLVNLLFPQFTRKWQDQCDRTTMTQADIDNGKLIMLIGIAPVKPAEFVIFRIGQWTGGSDVTEG